MLSFILDSISQYASYLRPTAFGLFIVGTVVAFYYSQHKVVRRGYVAGFITVLLVFNIVGASMLPMVNMHKFTGTVEEESTIHEVRLVDENGAEIVYDQTASPPVIGTRYSGLANNMVTEYDEDRQLEMATFLLERANDHREDVESDPSIVDWIQYPNHMDVRQWTDDDFDGYGEFETLRIYEKRVVYEDDSTGVAERSETLELEVDPDAGTVTEKS